MSQLSIADEQKMVIRQFQRIDSWLDRYECVIGYGKSLPEMNPRFKTDSNLIIGCHSKVWLHCENKGGILSFSADSDALITKGIIAMFILILSNRTPNEIVNAKIDFMNTIGLSQHLTPSRNNGVLNMIRKMKEYAIVELKKEC